MELHGSLSIYYIVIFYKASSCLECLQKFLYIESILNRSKKNEYPSVLPTRKKILLKCSNI